MDDSTSRETGHGADPAMRHLSSHVRFLILAAAALWLDLWTKGWAFDNLQSNEVRTFIPGAIEFRRSLNAGAVFGSFAGYTSIFIIASVFALGFVYYLFARSARTQRALHLALSLILAGAIGNLYDRAFIKADVVIPHTASAAPGSIIGSIVSQPGDDIIRIGDWPDGNRPRSFDRSRVTVRRQGVVRDFIKFVPKFPASIPKLAGRAVWPWVFNVADAALVCGVGILLIASWVDRKPHARTE
jgi:signal peptidase II